MSPRAITLITAIFALPLLASPAVAQTSDPRLEATYGDWAAYSRVEGNDKICYVLSEPKSKAPSNVRHGDIYFMVANWKSGAASEQPSFLAGFSLKTSRAPKARVGSTNVSMYVSDNESFIESGSDERRLVKAMRAGSTMSVTATSKRGTNVTYSFSLKGITAALKKAKTTCQ